MKWLWENGTRVFFGKGAVSEHTRRSSAHSEEVQLAKAEHAPMSPRLKHHSSMKFNGKAAFGRIQSTIVAIVKQFKPDLLLAVGGGSILDATKFISLAAMHTDGKDSWRILTHGELPSSACPVGSVITLPASGSEWNSGFVISRRSVHTKLAFMNKLAYPAFSLLDPAYTMTLLPRQLRNGAFDSLYHVIDQFLTSEPVPMVDDFWISVFRELIEIGPDLVKEGSSIELHERLIMAVTFAQNSIFTLGKKSCWGIHMIGHQLTAEYGIDHGATLAMCTPWFLESHFDKRKVLFAKVGEVVFKKDDTQDEKACACISEIRKYAISIGHAMKVSEV